MSMQRRFRWLPNALTISRAILAIPILLVALNESWAWAFWLFYAAVTTDFLDGLAAKKLQVQSKLGAELDPLADSSLVVAGMVGLSATGHLSWWFTAAVLAFGATVGNKRLIRAKNPRAWAAQQVASVSCLFIAWIGIAWYFAGLAFGWSWLYVPLTALILLVAALLKRHRLRAWLGITSGPDGRPAK